jgi:ribosomal protein S18 acetylase RimI-like enzyme
MPLVAISPAAAHEFDALAALMRATIEPLTYYNAPAIAAELRKYTADSLRARAEHDPLAVLVSRDAAGLTGFCVSRYDDATIWLDWFGVATRARGQGLGGALLAALKDTLPARGAHKIWCDSRTENVESRATLDRAGFRCLVTLSDHWYHQAYFLWEWVQPA